MKYTTISIKTFNKCDPQAKPIFLNKPIQVIKGTENQESEKFAQLAEIAAQQCQEKQGDCVATVPEWWQVRFEGGVEQLILSYRELKDDGTIGKDWYPITIPHPLNKEKTTAQLTGGYKKGNWQVLLTLNDNSKVILNAATEKEGLDFMKSQIKPLIDPAFLTKAKVKTAHFPDQGFTELKVIHKNTDFYATGQRKTKPTWRSRVKYP